MGGGHRHGASVRAGQGAENAGVKADLYPASGTSPIAMERFCRCAAWCSWPPTRRARAFHGLVTELLRPEEYDMALCCGPEPMMGTGGPSAGKKGTACLVSLEKKMACGVGPPWLHLPHHRGGRSVCKTDRCSTPRRCSANERFVEGELFGPELAGPVIAASGTFGYGEEYADILDLSALGGVCSKGLTLAPNTATRASACWKRPRG